MASRIEIPQKGDSGTFSVVSLAQARGLHRSGAITDSGLQKAKQHFNSGSRGGSSGSGSGQSSSAPADFQITSIDAPSSPLDFDAGSTFAQWGERAVNFDVTIENAGGQAATQEVNTFGNGLSMDKQVSVKPGNSKTVTLKAAVPDPDSTETYNVRTDDDMRDFQLSRSPQPEPANFAIASIDAPSSPLDFDAGSTFAQWGERAVNFDVAVENTGGQAGTQEIDTFGNRLSMDKQVSINPGDTKTVTLKAAVPDPDSTETYNVRTDDDMRDFQLSRAKQPATLSVDNIAPPSGTVAVGDPFTIDVTVTNVGQLSGSREVSVPGETQSTSDLSPGERETVTLEVDPPSSGGDTSYTVETEGGETQQFTITSEAFAQFQITDINAPGVIDPEEYPAMFDV